jgi:hypothetical protein
LMKKSTDLFLLKRLLITMKNLLEKSVGRWNLLQKKKTNSISELLLWTLWLFYDCCSSLKKQRCSIHVGAVLNTLPLQLIKTVSKGSWWRRIYWRRPN